MSSFMLSSTPYHLSRVDRVLKIRGRKQRADIGKYSFANRTIKNWNRLPTEALGTSLVNLRFLEIRKAIINGVK
jgi:hypothetical protein